MTPTPPTGPSQSLHGMAPIQGKDDLTAAIYARTSSQRQKYGYSIDEQVRQCYERCEQLGWTVSHVFRDEAVSGKDTDREMFQKMLTGAEEGWFDVVIVWKLDRFSRSLMHAVQLEQDLRQWDVGLHSVTEHIDTTTPTGRFNFQNISSASELEREMAKQRTEMGMRALAEQRKWPNDTPPLGYTRQKDGRLEVNHQEAELVEDIFEQYIQLKSMPDLADKLAAQSLPACREIEWTPHAVGNILKQELYIGKYDIAGVDEHVEEYRIIDDELFDQVTAVRNRFQRNSDSERSRMPNDRKQRYVENVLEQYSEFLNNRSEVR